MHFVEDAVTNGVGDGVVYNLGHEVRFASAVDDHGYCSVYFIAFSPSYSLCFKVYLCIAEAALTVVPIALIVGRALPHYPFQT